MSGCQVGDRTLCRCTMNRIRLAPTNCMLAGPSNPLPFALLFEYDLLLKSPCGLTIGVHNDQRIIDRIWHNR